MPIGTVAHYTPTLQHAIAESALPPIAGRSHAYVRYPNNKRTRQPYAIENCRYGPDSAEDTIVTDTAIIGDNGLLFPYVPSVFSCVAFPPCLLLYTDHGSTSDRTHTVEPENIQTCFGDGCTSSFFTAIWPEWFSLTVARAILPYG